MLKKITIYCLLIVLISGLGSLSFAFQTEKDSITTFILVRHAEKTDNSQDPDLSKAGFERADRLANKLSHQQVHAIYSTDFKRTRKTVEPLARRNQLKIKIYSTMDFDDLVPNWISKHRGETVVVSGHSNSTPTLANRLLGFTHFPGKFNESDYDNLLIVTIAKDEATKIIHLRYE